MMVLNIIINHGFHSLIQVVSAFMLWKLCRKLRSMRNGYKHSEASPLCDKIVFNKVINVIFVKCFCSIRSRWIVTEELSALSLLTLLGKRRFGGQCKTYFIWSSTSWRTCRRISPSSIMLLCSSRIWYCSFML